jgi:hypothetical protein
MYLSFYFAILFRFVFLDQDDTVGPLALIFLSISSYPTFKVGLVAGARGLYLRPRPGLSVISLIFCKKNGENEVSDPLGFRF